MWLENDRLKCRALEPEDLSLLYTWENDTRLWSVGNTLSPYSAYVLRQYLENAGRDIYEARQLRLMLTLKEAGTAVGTIDLYDVDPFHQRAGLGILIDPAHQKNGYAAMALTLMADYAFRFLTLKQLYAFIPADNLASLRLFKKAGYVEAGWLKKWNKQARGWCDVFVYQLLNQQ